jgi:hypothetical protein
MRGYPLSLLIVLAIIVIITLLIVGVVGYYNYRANKMPEQTEFNQGKIKQYPDGVYNGTATVSIGSWLGKQFNAEAKTGINRFTDGGRYSFTISLDQSLTDNREVFVIDYNQPSNPWWLRVVKDEIVQVGPNEFLGKIQIHPIPGLTLTYGYFRLKK